MIENKNIDIERAFYETAVFSKGAVTFDQLNDIYPLPKAIRMMGHADWLSKKMGKDSG